MRSRQTHVFPPERRERRGFTLIELLVVIAIVGLLAAMILPAVRYSREAARRVQCRDNLRQLSMALQNHESAHGVLPSNGWGWRWIGDPDRGVGVKQPGGWIYQILPMVERGDLWDLGAGLPLAERSEALGVLSEQNLPILRCPSRPAPPTAPGNPGFQFINAARKDVFGRTDYAINAGDFYYVDPDGPRSIEEGDSKDYVWPDTSLVSGICYLRSQVRWSEVTDGLSKTYLIGEKRVASTEYEGWADPGYDQSPFMGADVDIHRWTELPPYPDSAVAERTRFGSAHFEVFHMATCDGAVHTLSYDIDEKIFREAGSRNDGLPLKGFVD